MTEAPHQADSVEADEGGLSFDPREMLEPVRKHKWMILVVTVLAGLSVTLWTLRQPKVYEAVCTIEYDPNPSRPLRGRIDDVADPVTNFWATKEFYTTQNQILESRSLGVRVVRELSLHQNAGFMAVEPDARRGWEGVTPEVAAGRLQAMLTVTQRPESRIVEIRVRDNDPERAALIANTLAREYIEKSREDRLGNTRSALGWLQEQLDNLENQLEGTEVQLHEFKDTNDILSVSLQDRQNMISGRIQQLNEALTRTETRRIEITARLAQLRQAVQSDPLEVHATLISNDAAIQELRTRYRVKHQEKEALSERYGPNHPTIQAIDRELQRIHAGMNTAIEGLVSAVGRDLAEVRATEAGLRRSLDVEQDRGLALNELEIQYTRLARERDNGENLVKMLLERTAQTSLNEAVEVTNAHMVDDAVAPKGHVAPRLSVNVLLALVGGLLIGLVLAVLRMRLDRTVRSADDVEALGLTVLGVLPQIFDDDGPSTQQKKGRRLQVVEAADKDLIVHHAPRSAVAECCRAIRTNLTFMAAQEPFRTLVVTSPGPREGKTTVAVSLAVSIAQSGKKVLLVDTDLRRPRIHKVFGMRPVVGITTALVGEKSLAEVVHKTDVPNLMVLPCGPIPPNPAELLQTRAFTELTDEMQEMFDFVLFDSPPVTVVTDAAIVAPQLQRVLLVARAGGTTRESVRTAMRQLRDVGSNLVGSVMNDVDLNERSYRSGGYQYYYYRGEGYYTADEDDDTPTAGAAAS